MACRAPSAGSILDGWQLAEAKAGAISGSTLDGPALDRLDWKPADVPGTVASALRQAGVDLLGGGRDLDGSDWWFRTRFGRPPTGKADPLFLSFLGLATIADVWLNGAHVLRS